MHSKTLFAIALGIACSAASQDMHGQAQNPPSFNHDLNHASDNAIPPSAASQAAQMVPAEVNLAQTIESKNLKPGEQFKAILQGGVQLKNGVKLPNGTALVGTVAADDNYQGAKSELTLRFTQADLKGGKTIPIQATVVGISRPASDSVPGPTTMVNPPPDPWDGKTLVFDLDNVELGMDMHSKIAGQESALFVSETKKELKLGVRTQIALAIGAPSTTASNGGY
jgi:hypothetical protein